MWAIRNLAFEGCRTARSGGALRIQNGLAMLHDVAFFDNEAVPKTAGSALYVTGAQLKLERCLFAGNRGGTAPIVAAHSTLQFVTCLFSNNAGNHSDHILLVDPMMFSVAQSTFYSGQGVGPCVRAASPGLSLSGVTLTDSLIVGHGTPVVLEHAGMISLHLQGNVFPKAAELSIEALNLDGEQKRALAGTYGSPDVKISGVPQPTYLAAGRHLPNTLTANRFADVKVGPIEANSEVVGAAIDLEQLGVSANPGSSDQDLLKRPRPDPRRPGALHHRTKKHP